MLHYMAYRRWSVCPVLGYLDSADNCKSMSFLHRISRQDFACGQQDRKKPISFNSPEELTCKVTLTGQNMIFFTLDHHSYNILVLPNSEISRLISMQIKTTHVPFLSWLVVKKKVWAKFFFSSIQTILLTAKIYNFLYAAGSLNFMIWNSLINTAHELQRSMRTTRKQIWKEGAVP